MLRNPGYTGRMDAEVQVRDVRRVESRSGNTRWVLTDDAGREYTTFRPQIGEEAERHRGRRARIAFHEEIPPDQLYEKLEPFKRRVAEDIREGDDLNRVPFLPTVGNHDAGDSESSDDRDQPADNLFLDHRFRPEVETGSASLGPGLFYRFQVGANLEFICIDTSIATGMDVEHYFDDPAHSRWVEETLRGDGARWRIPFSHHPPFCAGPEHTNTTGMVERLVPLFEEAGVRLVLSGHEHEGRPAEPIIEIPASRVDRGALRPDR